jgi:hypothetical protein
MTLPHNLGTALHKLYSVGYSLVSSTVTSPYKAKPVHHSLSGDTHTLSGIGPKEPISLQCKHLPTLVMQFAWSVECQVAQLMISALAERNFVPGDMKKDFDGPIPGLYYVYLAHPNGQHTYVSVITFEGRFCEACWETFTKVRETRVKGKPSEKDRIKLGNVALASGISRSLEDLLTHLGPV